MSLYFNKYPSIEQFRNAVNAVRTCHDFAGYDDTGKPIYKHTSAYPTMMFRATVKTHGTNAAIGFNTAGYWCQSRTRVISPIDDNCGFAKWAKSHEALLMQYSKQFCHDHDLNNASTDCVIVYGEWCGAGIQSKVGVSKLPPMFIVFDICVIKNEKKYWFDMMEINRAVSTMMHIPNVYSVYTFGYCDVDVDFNNPEAILPVLDDMVNAVEFRCPVAAHFLPTDENLVGEGWVLQHRATGTRFKIKGEKHAGRKQSDARARVTATPEYIEAMADLICVICPHSRLEQGLFWLEHERMLNINDNKNLGEYIKWVSSDVYKESLDIIDMSGFTWKEVAKEVAKTSKQHFMNRLSVSTNEN